MSKLDFPHDFDFPPGENSVNKLIGKINMQQNLQSVAATATSDLWVADFAGTIDDLYLVLGGKVPAAGESMTFDVQKAPVGTTTFATILSGLFTLNSASTGLTDQVSLYSLILPGSLSFNPGDIFEVIRTYTAGGGPAPITRTRVVLEPSLKRWK